MRPSTTNALRRRTGATGLCIAALLCATAWAQQAPVEDITPTRTFGTPATATAPPDRGPDGGVATLYHQIQILQDEVRRLQGLVEEQEHRINRLVREQRERYLDLDQRILQLQGHAPGPDAPPTALATPPATNAAPDAQGEDQAYNAAFNAMRAARELPPAERAGEYEQAIDLFQAVIDTYPNGKLAANALYWQGEIRLASDELELARQAFAQLPSAFGNHAKVPDALYKLGVVHHRLGEDAEALRILDRVIAEYPDHSAARLARAYAEELR